MLADDVLMLLHHTETGRPLVSAEKLDLALAGALLVDLIERQRTTLTAPRRMTRNRKVVVTDAARTGDAVLDEALGRISSQRSARAQVVLSKVGRGLSRQLRERLAERDLLRREPARIVGVVPVGAWVAADARHVDMLRIGLREVVEGTRPPTREQAATVAILQAVGASGKALYGARLLSGAMKERAEAMASTVATAQVVRQALKAAAF
jgi:hypothetical protein